MGSLSRVAGLTRLDMVRSGDIQKSHGIQRLLLQIEKSQLRWLGHVLRMPPERKAKQLFLANPTGIKPRVLKNRSGHPLTKDDDILRRWREYFEEHLNPAQQQEDSPLEQKGTDITISVDQIAQAVKSLKNGKGAGIDEIRPEMLKALG
ncbi:unnamed protein product, partial [Soboliphyme baturini]|uniref:39S ribosomal protein L52, mitochondrial n=1 Tax=Soboliphyme baturini TaxID=241478 RepID=A0A183IAB0_9BILA